ncbi:MAG: serine hydrolase [Prevotellaceae bacterium]|nr:serine hydrolase [Prevotellaceae bacterium]
MISFLLQEYTFAQDQKKNTKLLPNLLKKEKLFDNILAKNSAYDVQIIYTQIIREKNNKIKFIDHYYNVNKNTYFYPSNTVFLPTAALTLEKINGLSKEYDVNKDRYVRIDNALTQGIMIYQDASSENNYASFAHFIKKMLTAGDKDSYNFCYDFLHQRYFNERMHNLGYRNSWFLHKFDNNIPETSRQSNVVTFFRTDMESYYIDIIYLKRHSTTIPFYSVYIEKGEYNPDDYYSNRKKILLGKKIIQNGSIIDSVVDFSNRNKFTIEDMHGFLKSLIFPEIHKNKPELSKDDYVFLYKQMVDNNSEFNYVFNDKLDDPTIKIFNNSGKDAGFMIDNAYVIDTKNGVDFFLTVVIKCNKTDILGDEYYEYEKIGLPFMRNISKVVHKYAISKNKQHINFNDFLNKLE